jgi:hypothetical protein
MNEIEIKSKNQKPKIIRLIILLLILAIFGWLVVFIFSYLEDSSDNISVPVWIFFLLYPTTIIISIIAGILAIYKIYKKYGKRIGVFSTVLGIIIYLCLILILMPCACAPKYRVRRLICVNNLRDLGLAIKIYSEENGGKYPVPDKWCDLLKSSDTKGHNFVCPSSKAKKCSYAINPNCEPKSPYDVVLLFETRDGWNQFGESEILTAKHKYNIEGKGCNILFNDGQAKFIKPNEIGKLKWKTE